MGVAFFCIFYVALKEYLTSWRGEPACKPGLCRAAAEPRRGIWQRCAWERFLCGWLLRGRWTDRLKPRGTKREERVRFSSNACATRRRVAGGVPSSSCTACVRSVWTRRSSSSSSCSLETICSSLRHTWTTARRQSVIKMLPGKRRIRTQRGTLTLLPTLCDRRGSIPANDRHRGPFDWVLNAILV